MEVSVQHYAPVCLNLGKSPSTRWVGGCVSPRSCLDILQKRESKHAHEVYHHIVWQCPFQCHYSLPDTFCCWIVSSRNQTFYHITCVCLISSRKHKRAIDSCQAEVSRRWWCMGSVTDKGVLCRGNHVTCMTAGCFREHPREHPCEHPREHPRRVFLTLLNCLEQSLNICHFKKPCSSKVFCII